MLLQNAPKGLLLSYRVKAHRIRSQNKTVVRSSLVLSLFGELVVACHIQHRGPIHCKVRAISKRPTHVSVLHNALQHAERGGSGYTASDFPLKVAVSYSNPLWLSLRVSA